MKITISGKPKEITALALELKGQPKNKSMDVLLDGAILFQGNPVKTFHKSCSEQKTVNLKERDQRI